MTTTNGHRPTEAVTEGFLSRSETAQTNYVILSLFLVAFTLEYILRM